MRKVKVLIGVDLQNDFVSGALGTQEARNIIPKVKAKVASAVNEGDIVVFTRDTHGENYLETTEGKHLPVKHCVKNTWGWEIVEGIIPEGYEPKIIDKPTFGSLDLAGFIRELMQEQASEGIEVVEIELFGLCTDICVVTNTLILKTHFPDIAITVDASCSAGVTVESHNAALLTMKMCQVNVINEEA